MGKIYKKIEFSFCLRFIFKNVSVSLSCVVIFSEVIKTIFAEKNPSEADDLIEKVFLVKRKKDFQVMSR